MVNIKNKLKDNKGFTGVDITVSIVIIMISITIIATMIYSLYSNGTGIKRNVIATDYAINILETSLSVDYEDLTFDNNNTLKNLLDSLINGTGTVDTIENSYSGVVNNYDVKVTISNPSEKYNNINSQVDNYIKIITVRVSYNSGRNASNNEINTEVIEISTIKTLN